MRLIHGDCLDALATLPDNSVDAVVTDPPAGIFFMGRAWDGDKGGRDLWIAWLAERLAECLRVLKPGGHAVVWALPRTSGWTHRALEDAGFDVRDCVHHLFGSGFPKSLDVGKAIDKQRDDRADVRVVADWLRARLREAGLSHRDVAAAFDVDESMVRFWIATHGAKVYVPTWEQWEKLRNLLGFGDEMDAEVWRLNGRKGTPGEGWEQRGVVGTIRNNQPGGTSAFAQGGVGAYIRGDTTERQIVGAPATPEAQQWDGWGTALKPAVEHWWLARKPLDSTVAGTVTRWGTGALNIDATRVAGPLGGDPNRFAKTDGGTFNAFTHSQPVVRSEGRWPADVVLTHSPACDEGVCVPGCAVAELDGQSGTLKSGRFARSAGDVVRSQWRDHECRSDVQRRGSDASWEPSEGGASRFFPTFRYQAKPSTREKSNGLDDRNHHPTCKPVELMRWLIRLVTPPGGIVLDCFAGSGTTGVAATLEGFDCVLIEAEQEYLPLIEGRVRWAEGQAEQVTLAFD